MGLLPTSKGKVLIDGPGRLIYREKNREYLFGFYEEDGEVIIVGEPSRWRIHYFFGWYWLPLEFSTAERERILPAILEHFRSEERSARVFDRGDEDGRGFVFYPELFEARGRAFEVLEEAGFVWFSDYSSIDLLHEEYGLEVCGIREARNVKTIEAAMREGFPQWHFSGVCHHDYGREPGWKFRIHMFRRRCGGGRVAE